MLQGVVYSPDGIEPSGITRTVAKLGRDGHRGVGATRTVGLRGGVGPDPARRADGAWLDFEASDLAPVGLKIFASGTRARIIAAAPELEAGVSWERCPAGVKGWREEVGRNGGTCSANLTGALRVYYIYVAPRVTDW